MENSSETYGPNNSPITKILHCAISSWDGFIYQSLCAICVVLEQILQNKDDVKSKYLNLEGYDDFAILDKDKTILSFHQAKCYKPLTPNFKDDMALMEDKRAYWYEKGLCTEDAQLYFHCNRGIDSYHNVSQYKYSNDEVKLSSSDILGQIDILIEGILDKYQWIGNTEHIKDSLISLFDKHVSFIDSEFKNGATDILQLSINNSIPISSIIKTIEQHERNSTIEDKIRAFGFYLNLNLMDRMCEEKEYDENVDVSKVERFLDTYNKLSKVEKINLAKRLFPHIEIEGKNTNIGDLTNQEVANYLYNVLFQTEEMDLDKIHWETLGQLHSPSTLGKSIIAKKYCGKIVKNRGSLPPELLRDYRWIVGDINESVSDIFESAHAINKISDEEYNNISKSCKVGLLSIEDKNDGNIY